MKSAESLWRRIALQCAAVVTGAVMGAAALAACASSSAPVPAGATTIEIANHAAVVMGSEKATVAVVMVHGRSTHKDSWYDVMPKITGAGYRAIAYDYDATGGAGIAAVVAYERAHGAKTIVLMGSSLGAGHVLRSAIPALTHPAAVITFSAVEIVTIDPAIPVFAIASKGDGNTAKNAHAIARGVKSQELIVTGATHGVDLVHPHPEVVDAIVTWLAKTLGANA